MKEYFIHIVLYLLFFISTSAFPQGSCTNPAPPSLTLVSVQPQTGNTDFQWTPSNSVNVAAYLIYIYHNEGGIPRGDIIDTVWNPAATNYTYNSTMPTYYSVSFVISAFRTPNCTSSFSNIINTIFASAAIDTCNKKIKINWNSYPSVPKRVLNYSVLAGVNGASFTQIAVVGSTITSFTLSEFESNAQYCFAIKASLEDSTFSTSNKVCLSTRMQQPPDWINADYATVDDQNNISLSFTIDPSSKINTFKLERQTENESGFTLINQILSTDRHLLMSDKTADPLRINYYRLQAVNNCGNSIVSSNLANNITLGLKTDGNLINLKWKPYKSWRGENSAYKIYMDSGDSFREIANLPDTDTSFNVSYASVMYHLTSEKLCFYAGAFEKNNPYGISGETFSSKICTGIIERITVPNAFTPNNDLKNDLFKPVLSFTPSEYHIVITNRQNKVLFESRDFNEEWDGKFGGEFLPDGVYMWFLKVRSPSGKVFTKSGTVTIIK